MPITPLSFKGDPKSKKRSKKRKADTLVDANDNRPTTVASVSTATQGLEEDEAEGEAESAQDSSWVNADVPADLSGPTMLVLPTHPTPSALACDAVGDVFAAPLENVVTEGCSAGMMGVMAATAEPHDVRQVWVVTRIAGTGVGGVGKTKTNDERDDMGGEVMVSFKGANGRYLSCGDGKSGRLRAEAMAVGGQESFKVSLFHRGGHHEGGINGGFLIGTTILEGKKDEEGKETFIYVGVEKESGKTTWKTRGRERDMATEETSMLWIRMQARFKPRFKANKEMKAKEKISRRELEAAVGRRLDEDEVRRLKKARKNGSYHEEVLDVRVKGKHDKFAC